MRRKQGGWSLWGAGFSIMCGIFLFVIFAKLFPVYAENYAVKSALSDLPGDKRLQDLRATITGKRQIEDTLSRRFSVNDVKRVNLRNDLKIIREEDGKGLRVIIQYEARVHMMANIDAVVSFDEQQVVPTK